MSQFNQMQVYGANSSPTVEQLLREGDGSRWSPTSSSPTLMKDHDPEEDIDHHHKKSVFTKVKEKARKLRYTLSNKKRHGEDDNSTPSWGYNLDDDEDDVDDDIDAEYLGAPMYESELAPEDCKENARQHPRADPVIAENHVLATLMHGFEQNEKLTNDSEQDEKLKHDYSKQDENLKHDYGQDDQKLFGSSETLSRTLAQHSNKTSSAETADTKNTILMKETPENEVVKSPKTLTESVTEKLAPVYSTVTDATHAIASKLHRLTVSTSFKSPLNSSPATPKAFSSHQEIQKTSSAPARAISQTEKRDIGNEQIWDKGVSVKEYLMHKFEPGEDERALSQVLSEAMSPRRKPGDTSVVEKMREAVHSIMRAEEPAQPVAAHMATKSSSNPPIYSNTHQGEEETLERILQAN